MNSDELMLSEQAALLSQLQQQYAELSDDELLHFASESSSLTAEAQTALDNEMRGRNLTALDIKNHARFVHKSELRETRRSNRNKLFGIRVPQKSGVEILRAFFGIAVAFSLILVGYFALPAGYRLPASWQEAALYTMFSSVFLAVWFFPYWGRTLTFWTCLLISTTTDMLVVHAWIVREGTNMLWRDRNSNRAAGLLGLFLLFVVYWPVRLVSRKFYGEQTSRG